MSRILGLSALLLALAACDSADDRAARHRDNATALLARGDITAATLEFRNDLQVAPNDREALYQLARIQMDAGAEDAAFGLFQRLVDNHPDVAEGWVTLAEIAIRRNRWSDAETFGERASALAPEDPRTALITAALDFRDAVTERDAAAAAGHVGVAQRHLVGEPDNLIARQLVISHAGTFGTPEDTLAEVEAAIEHLPDIYALHQLRVQTIAQLGRLDDVGPALETMADRFPDEIEPRQLLVDWYLRQGNTAAVDRFLRARATADDATLSSRLSLINFIRALEGIEAAGDEVDAQLALLPATATREIAILRGMRASVLFDLGDAEAGIAELRDALALSPGDEETANLRVALAQMLAATGREDEGLAEVEAVLAADSGHVEAAKFKSRWLIDRGDTDAAIRLLRQAQSTDPRDATVVMLMGQAHAQVGNWDLAGDRLAQAVDLSGNAPRESLIYADFLIRQGRLRTAEDVLLDAQRRAPADLSLMRALSELHIGEGRLDDARRWIAQMRRLDTDTARRTAETLEGQVLLRENRTDEVLALVEQMAAEGRGDAGNLAGLIQAQIAEGNIEDAKALLERQLAAFPNDPVLTFLRAGIDLVEGDFAAAEATYRELLDAFPGATPPLRVLHGLLVQQGREDDAIALLETVRTAAPDVVLARLLLAEHAERRGDTTGAIALYEELYAQDSRNLIVANNLANLLMAREGDAAALDRAFTVTRRLRGTQVPAFQHTFGWVAYLRGDYQTAVDYIARSAESLPNEPVVLLNLGLTYLALERPEEARAALERVIALAGSDDTPQAARARAALEGI